MTFDLDFWPWWKITYNLKTSDQILMQFHMLLFFESNTRGHIWPWALTLSDRIDDSKRESFSDGHASRYVQFCIAAK